MLIQLKKAPEEPKVFRPFTIEMTVDSEKELDMLVGLGHISGAEFSRLLHKSSASVIVSGITCSRFLGGLYNIAIDQKSKFK